MRLAARRAGTYRVRLLAGGTAAAVLVMMMGSSGGAPSQVGHQIFSVLSGLGLIFALLSGVVCTADSVSEEKRDGTLGLLFLTNLRGYDVVLGKLVVNSLSAAYALVAFLPILAFPVLLGSVTGSEFWRMNLLLLNALVFSLTTGLLVSACGKNERAVMLTTFFLILFVTLGLPLLWKAVTTLQDRRGWDWLLLFPSPAYAFRMVTDRSLRTATTNTGSP